MKMLTRVFKIQTYRADRVVTFTIIRMISLKVLRRQAEIVQQRYSVEKVLHFHTMQQKIKIYTCMYLNLLLADVLSSF